MLLLAVVIGFFGDYCWARWVLSCHEKRPFAAANWSLLIFTTSITYVYFIAEGHWYLLGGYIVGSYIGTFMAVKYESNS